MTLLALVALGLGYGLGPRKINDPVVNWVTLPESAMQIELHLRHSGTFEAHEWWAGAQTKPMPNFAIKGNWKQDGKNIVLDVKTTYGSMGEVEVSKTKTVPMRSVHLFWMDSLGREHSLTKTSRKPSPIYFGPAARLLPKR